MSLATNNSWLEWALLAALAFSTESGAGQTAVLLREVSVSRDTIRKHVGPSNRKGRGMRK